MSSTPSIVVVSESAQPPAKVWRVITEPALIEQWLMPNDFSPIVGDRFNFRSRPMGSWDGVVHCEVLELDPPRRLRYSWIGGVDQPGGPGSRLDTIVTIDLVATPGGGTRLRLEHAGFLPKNTFAFEMMGQGWREKIVPRIAEVAATLP